MSDSKNNAYGAANVRWDLTQLYKKGLDDPQIDADLDACEELAKKIHALKGTLNKNLGTVLGYEAEMTKLEYTLYRLPSLILSVTPDDEKAKQVMAKISERLSALSAEYLTFVSIEIADISEADYAALIKNDAVVAKHKPMLDRTRENKQYMLGEAEESLLSLLSPYGTGEWGDYHELLESELEIDIPVSGEEGAETEKLGLTQALNVVSESQDRKRRKKALLAVNKAFADVKFDRFSATALNMIMGQKAAMDKKRGYNYANPMAAKNIGNMIDDATVEALHEAGRTRGSVVCTRFYGLLRAILNHADGMDVKAPLKWSDRNAPIPTASDAEVSWQECMDTVKDAYGAFSPLLRSLVEKMEDEKWIDAPHVKGKRGGAFNASGPYKDGAKSFNFLNYLGSRRDVMTAAHEYGHGVHGLLAIEAQGPLMWHAPMPYAETASVFGEMLTFSHMLKQPMSDAERLDLLMGKINDFMNTVVRQLQFSTFEQRIHTHRRTKGKLSTEEFNQYWLGTCETFYGKDGDVFTYDEDMMSRLWCYVSHFHNCFYVYAYAFGELFTQALFAKKDDFGDQFVDMYLDLLRAGGTKGAVELTKPFGLDPRKPEFWNNGFDVVEAWIQEAEDLAKKQGISLA